MTRWLCAWPLPKPCFASAAGTGYHPHLSETPVTPLRSPAVGAEFCEPPSTVTASCSTAVRRSASAIVERMVVLAWLWLPHTAQSRLPSCHCISVLKHTGQMDSAPPAMPSSRCGGELTLPTQRVFSDFAHHLKLQPTRKDADAQGLKTSAADCSAACVHTGPFATAQSFEHGVWRMLVRFEHNESGLRMYA